MEIRAEGIVLIAPQNLVILGRNGQVKKQVYYPAPQLSGLLRALHGINAVRAGLYGAAASAYGDAFADASRRATDATTKQITGQLATAYTEGGAQLQGYARQSAAMATRRFKASLTVPSSVFMLTKSPEGKGNVLLQVDKVSAEPRAQSIWERQGAGVRRGRHFGNAVSENRAGNRGGISVVGEPQSSVACPQSSELRTGDW